MGTMNISLPDAMKEFVDRQVAARGYGTSSEYVRDLIRQAQDRERLRELLLDGLESGPAEPADTAFFSDLQERVALHAREPGPPQGGAAKARSGPRR
jgi:antitoxin ParD1/3/4